MNPYDVSSGEEQLRKLDDRDKAFKSFIIILLLVGAGLGLYGIMSIKRLTEDNRVQTEKLKVLSATNRARLDIGLCIFSVSPTRRTPEYVKNCYNQIEKESGIKTERFGDGV